MVPWQLPLAMAFLVGPGASETNDFDPWKQAAVYDLDYRAEVGPLAKGTDKRVRVWLPLPAETGAQKVLSTDIDSPWGHKVTGDAHGNRMVYVEIGPGAAAGTEIAVRCRVRRSPDRGTAPAAARPGSSLDPRRYVKSQQWIPLAGKVLKLAEQQSKMLDRDEDKIRAFYDYVVENLTYSKSGTGWGRGDAIRACTVKSGNCTDFHSLLIGMTRSQGIPARFTMGFPIPPDRSEGRIKGYHCWAEVFHAGRGWVPLDASEEHKARGKKDYFGSLPSDRVAFTIGRDLVLSPPQKGEPLNFFIYPYAEVDGKPAPKVSWTLTFRRLPEAGNSSQTSGPRRPPGSRRPPSD